MNRLKSLDFASNTNLSFFSFFFLFIDLYFLITAVIAQIFNPISELSILMRMLSKEAKEQIEIHLVSTETNRTREHSIYF